MVKAEDGIWRGFSALLRGTKSLRGLCFWISEGFKDLYEDLANSFRLVGPCEFEELGIDFLSFFLDFFVFFKIINLYSGAPTQSALSNYKR